MNEQKQATIRDLYNLPAEARFELLRDAIDNTVFKISASGRAYAIRLSKYDKQAGILFEAELLDHLAKTVPVPRLVRTADARPYITLDGQIVTLFDWLPGDSLVVELDRTPSLALAEQAGQLLGKIHAASASFRPTNQPQRTIDTEIKDVLQRTDWVEQFEGGAQLTREWREALTWEQSSAHQGGILHHDYIPSNLLTKGDVVTGVLDFDWSCLGPFGKDVGLALAIWSFPDGAAEHWQDIYEALLGGYNETAPEPFERGEYLSHWISYALLSETASFFNNLNEKNEYVPGRPITRVAQCRRYRKYEYFKGLAD